MSERRAIETAWNAMVQTRRAHAVVKNDSDNSFASVAVETLPAGSVVEHLIIPAHWGFTNNPPEILWRYKQAA